MGLGDLSSLMGTSAHFVLLDIQLSMCSFLQREKHIRIMRVCDLGEDCVGPETQKTWAGVVALGSMLELSGW